MHEDVSGVNRKVAPIKQKGSLDEKHQQSRRGYVQQNCLALRNYLQPTKVVNSRNKASNYTVRQTALHLTATSCKDCDCYHTVSGDHPP